MAKCITENYKLDGNIIYHNVEAATQDGIANAELVAGDDSYRYSGADGDVKNYVCLDGTTTGTTCAEEDLYRIIGLFKNGNNYEMKVIKSSPAISDQLGGTDYKISEEDSTPSAYRADSENKYYWNNKDGNSSTNKWGESNLNKVNLNGYYLNSYLDETKNINIDKIISAHTWIVGGNTNNNIEDTANMKTVYENEITSEQARSETYTEGKIGLMYASDYGYAASSINWTTKLGSYSDGNVITNNWMYMNNGQHEWTLSHDSDNSYRAFYVLSNGDVNNTYNLVYSSTFAARPVFYLSSSVKLSNGEGSKTEDPIKIPLT